MRTVYLHAGTPKTGTTALQDFLPDNIEILHKHNYDYPFVPCEFRGVAPGQTAHFLAMWEPGGRDLPPEWDIGFSVMKEASHKYENVIFSDEQLWWRQHKEGFWEEVLRRAEDIGVTIKVIVYLRRQDDQLESFYNEKVKGMPKLTMTFSEYIASGDNDYFPLDYAAELDRFASYVGADNLIVRVYEKNNFAGGNIFADFLDAVGLELNDEYRLPERHANTRWPERVVEVKRMVNHAASYHRRKVPNFYRNAIEEAYGIGTAKEFPAQEYGMFSAEERKAFMKHYEEGNAYVARTYLHRANGVLFQEKPVGLPKWEPRQEELIEDAIRVLGGADIWLYKQLDDLVKQADAIENGLLYRIYLKLKELRAGKRK